MAECLSATSLATKDLGQFAISVESVHSREASGPSLSPSLYNALSHLYFYTTAQMAVAMQTFLPPDHKIDTHTRDIVIPNGIRTQAPVTAAAKLRELAEQLESEASETSPFSGQRPTEYHREHHLSAATRLRRQITDTKNLIVCPGVYDGFSARIAMSVGFDAMYMVSRIALAWDYRRTNGHP